MHNYEVILKVREAGSIGAGALRTFLVESENPYYGDEDKGALFDLWQDQYSWTSNADEKWEPMTGILSFRKVE